MPPGYALAWLSAFAFTQLVEVPIYRRAFACSFLAAFGASAVTHPIVWFAIFPFLDASYVVKTCVAELFAWSVEAAYFAWALRRSRALLVSLLANSASVALGLLSRYFFGAP